MSTEQQFVYLNAYNLETWDLHCYVLSHRMLNPRKVLHQSAVMSFHWASSKVTIQLHSLHEGSDLGMYSCIFHLQKVQISIPPTLPCKHTLMPGTV